MSALTEFLLARIAEDEERARMAICQCGGPVCTPESGWMHMGEAVARLDSKHVAEHVVEWSPARVLAKCAADRAIVEIYQGELDAANYWESLAGPFSDVVRLLARPYADHPDYAEATR